MVKYFVEADSELEYGYECTICDRKFFKVAMVSERFELWSDGLKGKALKAAGNVNNWNK
jgi:hypothetical protein